MNCFSNHYQNPKPGTRKAKIIKAQIANCQVSLFLQSFQIPPGQISTKKTIKKLVLRMIKCVFHKEKLDQIDTVYEKHIYHSQDQLVVGF